MLRCFIFAILVFLDVEQFLELGSSCSRQPKGNDKDRDFGQKHVVYECWDLSHTHWLHHQCPSQLFFPLQQGRLLHSMLLLVCPVDSPKLWHILSSCLYCWTERQSWSSWSTHSAHCLVHLHTCTLSLDVWALFSSALFQLRTQAMAMMKNL